MSILSELLNLRESRFVKGQSVQAIVKLYSVPIGTLEKVFGEDAPVAIKLLRAKLSDQIYELKSTNVNAEATKKLLVNQAFLNRRADDMYLIKLIGHRKLLVWKNRVLTSEEEYDDLVEGQGDAERHSLRGKASNAFNNYLSPFDVGSLWVNDARGHSVCEARDMATAKVICDLLNTAYPVKSKKVDEALSAKDERDVQNVGRFSRDQALANGQSRDKAAEISKKAMATRRKNLTK